MNRVYVITYNIVYAHDEMVEKQTVYYSQEERANFIGRYKYLTDPKRWYINSVQCFTCVPEPIKDMNEVINAI